MAKILLGKWDFGKLEYALSLSEKAVAIFEKVKDRTD